MVHYAGRDVAKWQRLDDAARELHMSDTLARFNKMHGDQAPAMLEGARRLVAELCTKDPTLKSFLEDSGAGASLAVINALAAAAKRRIRHRVEWRYTQAARRGGRGDRESERR